MAQQMLPTAPRVLVYCPAEDPILANEQFHQHADLVVIAPWEPGQALRGIHMLLGQNTKSNGRSNVERRLSKRLPAQHLTVQVLPPKGVLCRAKAVDISRGGILVDVKDMEPLIGDTIHVLVSLPNWRPTTLKCKVRRIALSPTQRGCLIGAEFLSLDGWGLTTLNLVLAGAHSRKPKQQNPQSLAA